VCAIGVCFLLGQNAPTKDEIMASIPAPPAGMLRDLCLCWMIKKTTALKLSALEHDARRVAGILG
jgi:hypothetical protein